MLAYNLGALRFDDVMSYNSLTTLITGRLSFFFISKFCLVNFYWDFIFSSLFFRLFLLCPTIHPSLDSATTSSTRCVYGLRCRHAVSTSDSSTTATTSKQFWRKIWLKIFREFFTRTTTILAGRNWGWNRSTSSVLLPSRTFSEGILLWSWRSRYTLRTLKKDIQIPETLD